MEPFTLKPKPFSLLAHQTLSTLMTYGELSPPELARSVLFLPAFRKTITQDEYRLILRYMIAEDYLQRVENGAIIVGIRGERITNHYSFYAVFQDEQAYHVQSKEGEIGTLDSCPTAGEVFVLAGRTWKTLDVDMERKIVYVAPVRNNRIPSWNGSGGHIHTKIIQRMKKALEEDVCYPYLTPRAQKVLEAARSLARESGMLENSILPCGENSFYFCPWVGSKTMKTIKCLLSCGLKEPLQIYSVFGGDHYLQITSGFSGTELFRRMAELSIDMDDPDMVLPEDQIPQVDKYDTMIPGELLRSAFLHNELDMESAIDVLKDVEIYS